MAVAVRQQVTGWGDEVPLSSLVIDFCSVFLTVGINCKFQVESTPSNKESY